MTAIFLWIPKTAGLSIYDALKPHGIERRLDTGTFSGTPGPLITHGHVSLSALKRANLLPEDSWIFTFVRNPYDRAVSLWTYLSRIGLLGSCVTFREFCYILRDRKIEPIGLYNKKGLSQCRPQAAWLRGVHVHYTGRFETLHRDFNHICARLNITKPPLTHRNRSDHDDYRSYYDAETQGIVREYYAEDFELLGYGEAL